MFRLKNKKTTAVLVLILPALLALVCCGGCGSKDTATPAGTGAPAAAGTASLPPQAQAAAQAQEKADAANRAAHAPH